MIFSKSFPYVCFNPATDTVAKEFSNMRYLQNLKNYPMIIYIYIEDTDYVQTISGLEVELPDTIRRRWNSVIRQMLFIGKNNKNVHSTHAPLPAELLYLNKRTHVFTQIKTPY